MKRLNANKVRRGGFTLVELIVVIGLMALLSTISIAGYNAASQGMKNRGVVQDVVSLLRQAMQTAVIDRTPTAVLFYNRLLDRDGKASGFAVAIKQTGRITMLKDNLLIDEFADWQQSFSTAKPKTEDPGARLFRMQDENQLQSGLDQCSTLMHSYVTSVSLDDYMISARRNIREWADDHRLTTSDNKERTSSEINYANNYVWGRGFRDGNSIGWKPGDAYGVEFGSVQLPEEYIFGSSVPTATGLSPASVAAVVFDPEKERSDGTIALSRTVIVARGKNGSSQWKIDNSMLND